MPKDWEEDEETEDSVNMGDDVDKEYGDEDSGEETFQESSNYEFAGDEEEDGFGEDW